MASFNALLHAHQRLCILRALAGSDGYAANESLLQGHLEAYGIAGSRDVCKTQMHWLAEQGLVTLTDRQGLLVATITNRGQEVAEGRVTVPGVQRPSPDSLARALLGGQG